MIRLASAGAALVLGAQPAAAHGFGQRFDLPLPLHFWVWGAGLTIVLSFVVMAVFVREHGAHARAPATAWRPMPRVLVEGLRWFIAGVFVVAVAAGLFGVQESFNNLIVPLIWVAWWVGLAFICALVGNLWAVANPLQTLFALAEPIPGTRLRYPPGLGCWPAVVLFLVFAWCELVWPANDVPALLATAVLIYAAITWVGMAAFGTRTWLDNAEAFSVAFGVLGRFAAIGIAPPGCWQLRLPGAGLLDAAPGGFAYVAFVLTMLSTVTFDGFLETPLFQDILSWIYSTPVVGALVYDVTELGISDTALVKSVALVAFPLAFVAAFVATCWLMVLVTRRWRPAAHALAVAHAFVLTLVPIAVAYHLAHYFSLLLTAGQFVIPLASDPFGFGWDLFGTRGYQVDIGIVSPRVFWYAAVSAIVIGHVIAVYLAHVVALRLFGGRTAALVSQIPMVALMVGYTMISLWILAQPIVG